MKRLRLEDIAEFAGVSKATVSMVLNNRKGVGDATRRRVLDVVAEHGYLPKSLVDPSRLYTPKTIRFLAFATDEVVSEGYGHSPFFGAVLHGIEAESRDLGYELTFASLQSLADLEALTLRNTSSGDVLLGTNLSEDIVRSIVTRGGKTVVLDTSFDFVDANFVVLDNAGGAFTATEYLIGLRHRHIGYVQSRTRIRNFDVRKRGFHTALERHGLALLEEDTVTIPSDVELAEQAFARHVRERTAPWPTAFFCENDYMALGVLKALRANEVDVPGRVSVMGFDDVALADMVEPALTTMRVDKRRMGALAVRRLVEICESPQPVGATKVALATRLVERASCAPPAVDGT